MTLLSPRPYRLTVAASCVGLLVSTAACTSDSSNSASKSSAASGNTSVLAAKEEAQSTPAAAELTVPGGGRTVFPKGGRRYVAMYGHPGTPALGVLGEQGLKASVSRAKRLAAPYAKLTRIKVIPTFEIIATVATAHKGPKGTYSAEFPASKYLPWVKEAQKQGVYVVLDLQPGRASLLSQAKLYESLLKYPNVGLAIDPEWKLQPGQRPLRQIGHVDASEINQVSAWLAAMTKREQLPQKMLVLHQFRLDMIRNRAKVNTKHPQLAVVIHADGQGGQGQKQETWKALHKGTPARVQWGWKNFYDEDRPTLSPRQTMTRVKPHPMLVSYQ